MTVKPNIHLPIIALSELSDQNVLLTTDNPKKLCLVYEVQHDTEACHEFLEKVFNAVQLDFQKQCSKVIIENNNGFSLTSTSIFKQHEIWICLGIEPKKLGLNLEIDKYGLISFQGNHVLWADNPIEILNDPNLKKQLWVSLQKLFPNK